MSQFIIIFEFSFINKLTDECKNINPTRQSKKSTRRKLLLSISFLGPTLTLERLNPVKSKSGSFKKANPDSPAKTLPTLLDSIRYLIKYSSMLQTTTKGIRR